MHSDQQQAILAALGQASVPRAVGQLAAEERWAMLRDTLLGHPPLRGGLRPRDLPLDTGFRSLLKSIAGLHDAVLPPTVDRQQQYRFGDWLYAFAAIVEVERFAGPTAAPPLSHLASYWCMLEVRRACGLAEQGDVATSCGFLHRLLAAVGWSMNDWNYQHRQAKSIKDLVHRARLAARVSSLDAERAATIRSRPREEWHDALTGALSLGGTQRAQLQSLQQPRFRILTAKTGKVQDYLRRGRRHWLMRGASSWCGQVLAWFRDSVPDMLPAALLLSDSDVLVAFLIPADEKRDAGAIRDRLWSAWQSPEAFLERFPRLRELATELNQPGIDCRDTLPEISLRISDPTSLLELCLPQPDESGSDAAAGGSVACCGPRQWASADGAAGAGEACPYVHGDPIFTTVSPPWLEDRPRRSGADGSSGFGLTSLVWSLCGTTLRTQWFDAVATANQKQATQLRMMPVSHGVWLKNLGVPAEPLTFLKLDGDDVGTVFRKTPIPRRPAVGVQLSQLVLARVLAATEAVVRQRQATGCPPDLPVDLVYIGGDDIFVCLPQSSVETFLAGFSGLTAAECPPAWKSLVFTFASVTLPPPALLPPGPAMRIANLLGSRLAARALEEMAKPSLAAIPPAPTEEAARQGFRLEICGAVEERVVTAGTGTILRGTHLQLLPDFSAADEPAAAALASGTSDAGGDCHTDRSPNVASASEVPATKAPEGSP